MSGRETVSRGQLFTRAGTWTPANYRRRHRSHDGVRLPRVRTSRTSTPACRARRASWIGTTFAPEGEMSHHTSGRCHREVTRSAWSTAVPWRLASTIVASRVAGKQPVAIHAQLAEVGVFALYEIPQRPCGTMLREMPGAAVVCAPVGPARRLG